MKTCVIFCAGEFSSLSEPVMDGDFVIAADGGVRHLQKLHRMPDCILGDFDSLGFVPEGAQVFPVEKDDTDAMLAVRRGLAMGCRRFVLYGGMDGARLDHTVANFQALQYLADQGAVGYLVGLTQMAAVIKNGSAAFSEQAEGIISVFCMGADAQGVTIRGLQYELTDGTLGTGYPLGVSNHFIGKRSEISVRGGSLLVIWDRKNGFPTVE